MLRQGPVPALRCARSQSGSTLEVHVRTRRYVPMSPGSIERAGESGEDVAALIAAQDGPEAIAAALRRLGLRVAAFDCPASLVRQAGARKLAVIVVRVHDTTALRRLIDPLRAHYSAVPLVVVCPSIERRAVRAALAAGTAGVVLDADLERALDPCVQAVRAGQVCLPRRNWQQIETPVLSSREKEVLGLLVMGYMNSQIAERLFLAESTVKSHLSSAFHKLGVRSRHEAVARILDPHGGLGIGILAVGGEPVGAMSLEAR
jgi:DNA-binding NarL/FixJ family response regulator